MKKFYIILFLISSTTLNLKAQNKSAFDAGEWFKFEMSYSGFFKAGYTTIEVKDNYYKGTPVYHIIGKGWTTGAIKWFFKVEDRYETYIDKKDNSPYKFVRKIDEGGHTKNIEIEFDKSQNKAFVHNKKKNTRKTINTKSDVQDMVSTFYYLRNKLDIKSLKKNDEISVNMFFDEENYPFRLKYLGEEIIETEFGNIASLKFRPYVMAGRVFKEEESLTLWVSNDENKLPLRVKADLAVGSLRADLTAFKGLIHPFKIIAKP
ncbi:DUF3108 domain-containing protein [Formosa sp. L2A11]|uniref:DUF3108 domain-containing protein n=1 Tax=Formosa sp. L2A11 TaxID=2686363 RepID=UPI00131B6646|nr:DUF3108 domain-containing protein [Formosa sp. L2A11]